MAMAKADNEGPKKLGRRHTYPRSERRRRRQLRSGLVTVGSGGGGGESRRRERMGDPSGDTKVALARTTYGNAATFRI